jgi:hypothetical protein
MASKAAIQSALSDVTEVQEGISVPLKCFVCSNGDTNLVVIQAEAHALTHLHSKYFEFQPRFCK